MRINLVFAVDAPLLRLLCLSRIKFKEPLKMNYILAGFLHLSKVFDTVDHNIFFAKLDQYGLFPLILNQQTANKFRFRSTTNDIWGTKRLCAWPSIIPDLY